MKDKDKNVMYHKENVNMYRENPYRQQQQQQPQPRKKDINYINLPNFFESKEYKILNPYNFLQNLTRLQSIEDEYFLKDMDCFAKKEFDFEYDSDDKYTCPLENLMIFTDFKERDDQNYLNLVNMVDFSQFVNQKADKKIEFRLYDCKRKEINIKVFVDPEEISQNIDDALHRSPFEANRNLVQKCKEYFEKSNKKTPEFDISIKYNNIKKIYDTNDDTVMIIELSNPPLYKTNFLRIEDGSKKNEFENILFPFRDFENEIANLKYRKYYLLLKACIPVGDDVKNEKNNQNEKIEKNEKMDFNIHGTGTTLLRSFFDIISDKIDKINYKICAEHELRKKYNWDFELNDYFIFYHKKFTQEFGFDEATLISFNYCMLVLVSENILSYFHAIAFMDRILKFHSNPNDYFRTVIDNTGFKPILFAEAIVKIIELYKNSGVELTFSSLERQISIFYNECKLEYDLNGEKAFKKKNIRLIRNMRILVTPTYTLFLPYIDDQGNRILREHRQPWEAIRLVFKMDDFQDAKWNNKILTEFIKIHLLRGIKLCLSNYEFFCYSQSQFRSMGCWLVINPDEILEKTGDYSNIKVIAKYGARVGQTLTSTTQTIKIHRDNIVFLPKDITNGTKFVFSDGVGTISYDLAKLISEKLEIDEVPAAFQGRFLGCKGVWTTIYDDFSSKIYIRPSQKKFDKEPTDDNQRFEVCSYSKFIKSYLNRQIILLLSSLGIEDEVFIKKLVQYRNRLEDEKFILSLIHYDEWNSTFMRMYLSGINRSNDRLVRSIVSANKEILYRDLKKKARIYIEDGAYVTGILDEFGVLEYGEAFLKVKTDDTDMIINKRCPVAKCPCLHPGDIRILNFKKYDERDPRTHKYKQLEIYENVIIFPQKGKRPHPNELSGSDLDGDQYFIFYDDDLSNVTREVEAMDYSDNSDSIKKDVITRKDIIEFFAEFVNNNNLGLIADAHLAHSDNNKKGADGDLPKLLAKKFSLAVDAPKTGAKIILSEEEEAKQFPHYMGRENKSYHSTHVLGKLYDKTVKFIEEVDKYKSQNYKFYDDDLILAKYQNFTFEALIYYIDYYEELLGVLKKNDIQSESELLTGNNLDNDISGFGKKKNNYDVIDRISIQMKELFSKYKSLFYDSSNFIFGDKSLNYGLRNNQSIRASAFYYVSYDFLKIINEILKNVEELEEMKFKFLNVMLDDPKFNDEQAVNGYSHYMIYTQGGDFSDQVYCDNAYVEKMEEIKELIKNKLDGWKSKIHNFIFEKTKLFKIPNGPNDENQFRILSFPWCSAGEILIKIKDLKS
jgi:hypothetical protein